MRRALIFFLLIACTVPLSLKVMGASAQDNKGSRAYNWYCMKAKMGERPHLPSEFSFIGSYSGYYVDEGADTRGDKVIYLTFDCGYENGNVEKILDILKKHNAKSAFFILGNLVRRNTDLVKRMCSDGHLVCNHTASHKNMTRVSGFDEFRDELKSLEELMLEYCGERPAPYYRPPEGSFNEDNLKWASELGYSTVFWSCAYDDWDNNRQMPSQKAMDKLMSRLHNGEVLLLHPTSSTNAEILDGFLTSLEKMGYRFGTLDELVCKD